MMNKRASVSSMKFQQPSQSELPTATLTPIRMMTANASNFRSLVFRPAQTQAAAISVAAITHPT